MFSALQYLMVLRYAGKALSKWGPDTRMGYRSKTQDPNETRAVFVDENSCIGCMNCVHNAPRTFRMNPLHGKARVFCQWLDEEDALDTAIQSCPVDCIHWVEKEELPALEYVCQNVRFRTFLFFCVYVLAISMRMCGESH